MANTTTVNLEMIRGDTLSFDLILHDIDPASIESLYFTVKRRATDADSAAVLQKSIANGGITRIEGDDLRYRVRVAPADTAGVAARTYAYDVQVGIGGDIFTFVRGNLTVEQDVTEAIE